MTHWSWELGEKLSWPGLLIGLKARGAGSPSDLIEERVAYGDDPAQHVLVIRRAPAPPVALLVYFCHGGSWRHGSPSDFRAVGRFFARAGYTAVLGGYRLAPGSVFPAQRDDTFAGIAAALAYTRERGCGGGPLVVAGQSAGAHLAALAAFDEDSRAAAGLADVRLAGALLVSGPLDFDALCPGETGCPLVEGLMGGRDGWEHADPARFVHGAQRIPILCLHGSRDLLVPPEVAASFVMRANGSEGDHATFAADPSAHHADMIRLFFGTSPLTPMMLDWLAEVTRPHS